VAQKFVADLRINVELGDFPWPASMPTMGLSPLYVDGVLELVGQVAASGVTVFTVEPNAGLALRIAHYTYVLQTGRIILRGKAGELAWDPRIRDANSRD
jgi:branched-chain amino acid transport system ATP-binding protein